MGLAIGALGLHAVAYYQGRQSVRAEAQPSEADDKSSPSLADRCNGLATSQEAVDCLKAEIAASDENERAQRDVNAQESMALSAVWMAVITFILGGGTLWVSAYAARLLLHTLAEARATTKSAAEAAQAASLTLAEARTANEIARDGLVAQHRPWLVFDVDGPGHIRFSDGQASVNVELTVKNVGTAPAVMVLYDVEAYWTYSKWPSLANLEALIEQTKRSVSGPHRRETSIIMPNDDMKFGFAQLNAKSVVPLPPSTKTDREIGIVAACCVVYKSPVSDKWLHTANMVYIRRRIPKGGSPRDIRRFKWSDGEVGADELFASISRAGGTNSIA